MYICNAACPSWPLAKHLLTSPQLRPLLTKMLLALRLVFGILLVLPCLTYGHGPRGGGGGPVAVRGYVKSDGTYVQPHMRSAPDGNFSNNWSTVGNVNPYTGAVGTKTNPSGTPAGHGLTSGSGSALPTNVADIHKAEGVASAQTGLGASNQARTPDGVTLPEHAKLNYLRNGWECVRGYHQVAGTCVAVEMPLNAKLNYLGSGWECVRGYHQVGQACAAVEMPANAKLNYLGNGWDCQRGYRQAGLECVAVQIPANAKLNYLGNGWDCQRGYRQAGPECVVVQVPVNAKLNYLGNGWDCQRGYHQVAQACVAVQVPENARLNYLGNGWQCQPGFKQAADACVASN
jgi:hypothetical protein